VVRVRFGLIGTGFWARHTHAAGIAAAEGAELAGVWGRDPAKASELAAHAGTRAFPSVAELLEEVEAVAFAVPPDVQVPLAVAAARRGKHLLLEKPLALTTEAASAVVGAVADAGVASVVFFTDRFAAETRDWWTEIADGEWEGGLGVWTVNAFHGPFATPWRRQHGGLWDVGPHAVSNLATALGPVIAVQARGGARDLVLVTLGHETGATSSAVLTLTAPPAASRVSVELWGPRGWTSLPVRTEPAWLALRDAAADLMSVAAGAGVPHHACDAAYGWRVVEVLAEAQRQLDDASGGT
jgi:predicted dehydrogenase